MIDPALTMLRPPRALSGNTAGPLLVAEMDTSTAVAVIGPLTGTTVPFSVGAAWAAATQLAGAALVVVACVRAYPPTASTGPSAGQS